MSNQDARETLYLFNERDYFAEKVESLLQRVEVYQAINTSLNEENSLLKLVHDNDAENLRVQKEMYISANEHFNDMENAWRKKWRKNTIIIGGVAVTAGIIIGILLAK